MKNRLLARLFTAIPSLASRWGKRLAMDAGEIPWAVPRKPLKDAVLALVTTGGVHLQTDPPFNMADPNGDPSFREIPAETAPDALVVTHDYYDHRDADKDLNLVFPMERARELVAAGALRAVHSPAYGLMGHIDGPHLPVLQDKTAPEIARRLAEARVDYALLVPA
jgi:D-proline reductase (dithiol) PrdB